MPQIIVTAGDAAQFEGTVLLRERINTSDFESDRFTANLLERIGWAVSDAAEAEKDEPQAEEGEPGSENPQPRSVTPAEELVKA